MTKILHPLLRKPLSGKLLQTQIDRVQAGATDTDSPQWNARALHYLRLIRNLAVQLEKMDQPMDVADLMLPNIISLLKNHKANNDRDFRDPADELQLGLLVIPVFDTQWLRDETPTYRYVTCEQWLLSLGHLDLVVDAQEKFLLMLLSQAYSRDWVQEMVQDAQK